MTKNYPFLTKAQILSRINSDFDYALSCLRQIAGRQTEDEVETRDTKWKNRRGFMSSHAKVGVDLAFKDSFTEEEAAKVVAIASRYSKQLAESAREKALRENPELAAIATVYGV
jgi:hypothetical protein